jgi:hypothetical protein
MYSQDLTLSAKFSNYLAKIGILEPLINCLKQYRDHQNYPFVLSQKRIIKQSVFKALCEYYSNSPKKPKVDTLLAKVEEIAEKIYGKDPMASEEIFKDIQEAQKKLKEKPEIPSTAPGVESVPIIEQGEGLPPELETEE